MAYPQRPAQRPPPVRNYGPRHPRAAGPPQDAHYDQGYDYGYDSSMYPQGDGPYDNAGSTPRAASIQRTVGQPFPSVPFKGATEPLRLNWTRSWYDEDGHQWANVSRKGPGPSAYVARETAGYASTAAP
ncbi:hypothetical protein BBP40_006603 [Aspergillus hancockii]|nr:hypothetical protein BBP40_006603 [Aspergillus hancockii]